MKASGNTQPELTLRAIVIGLALSVIMGAANVYLGLKAGLTVSASIPAAVLGGLLLRSMSRGRTVLEANQIQTAASAGESLAAGIIFTMPALLMIGYWQRFEMWSTTLIALTGGLLGVLFMIPMRRVFIVGSSDLPYPEGVACAAVLEATDREGGTESGGRSILAGGLLGAAIKLAISGLGVVHGALETAFATTGGRVFYLGSDVSPALIAIGFIVRLNVALLVGLGGAIGWLVCLPLMPEIRALLDVFVADPSAALPVSGSAMDRAGLLRSTQIRYIGVGAMLVGGLASLWHVRRGLLRAISELRRSALAGSTDTVAETDRDMSGSAILALATLAISGVIVVYLHFTGDVAVTLLTTLAMVVLSFFFVAVASYIVGLVGNSNSPVSGMTITAVLITALLLYQFGYTGMEGMVASLGVAAIVCCAACTAGDTCNDLKTGSLVGASPRRQQLMQILGIAVASVVMAPVLQLLQDAYGIGGKELSAPQAGLFASLAQGFFGDGALPWDMVGLGIGLGVVVLAIDASLARRGASFRAHLMPLAVGIYLPFGLAIPIVLGGLLAHLHARGTVAQAADDVLRRGVLFCSGAIAGEALTGVGIALFISMGVAAGALEIPFETGLSVLAALGMLAAFYFFTRPYPSTSR